MLNLIICNVFRWQELLNACNVTGYCRIRLYNFKRLKVNSPPFRHICFSHAAGGFVSHFLFYILQEIAPKLSFLAHFKDGWAVTSSRNWQWNWVSIEWCLQGKPVRYNPVKFGRGVTQFEATRLAHLSKNVNFPQVLASCCLGRLECDECVRKGN
jgi:hypothetical protein